MRDTKPGLKPTKKGKLLIIDVDHLDFVKNKEDLNLIIQKVDQNI